jgi:hypothetical protein
MVEDEGKAEELFHEEGYHDKKAHDESFRRQKRIEEEALRKKKALQKAMSRKDKMTLNRVSLVKQVQTMESSQAMSRNVDRCNYSKLRTYEKQENMFRVTLRQKFNELFT